MDENHRKQLGDRIRTARKARGWSQARLAEAAGISENTVLSIELGKRTPQGTKLRAVLDALGLAAPADGVLDLEDVPDDVRVFAKVAVQRLKVLPDDRRALVLADIYPRLLLTD